MNRSLRACFVLIPVLAPALCRAAQAPPTGEIAVRVYNLADASAPEIARATSEASEIFERIGVGLVWLDCPGPSPRGRCNAVQGPGVLNLRLMPADMEPPGGLPRGIFGFALVSDDGGFATIANVYLERVSEISDGRKYRRPVVLGAMMAHELGHLLLGVNSHSKKGLMTLPWGPKVLTAADQGALSFSKREAARIREAAQARVSARGQPLAAGF